MNSNNIIASNFIFLNLRLYCSNSTDFKQRIIVIMQLADFADPLHPAKWHSKAIRLLNLRITVSFSTH